MLLCAYLKEATTMKIITSEKYLNIVADIVATHNNSTHLPSDFTERKEYIAAAMREGEQSVINSFIDGVKQPSYATLGFCIEIDDHEIFASVRYLIEANVLFC